MIYFDLIIRHIHYYLESQHWLKSRLVHSTWKDAIDDFEIIGPRYQFINNLFTSLANQSNKSIEHTSTKKYFHQVGIFISFAHLNQSTWLVLQSCNQKSLYFKFPVVFRGCPININHYFRLLTFPSLFTNDGIHHYLIKISGECAYFIDITNPFFYTNVTFNSCDFNGYFWNNLQSIDFFPFVNREFLISQRQNHFFQLALNYSFGGISVVGKKVYFILTKLFQPFYSLSFFVIEGNPNLFNTNFYESVFLNNHNDPTYLSPHCLQTKIVFQNELGIHYFETLTKTKFPNFLTKDSQILSISEESLLIYELGHICLYDFQKNQRLLLKNRIQSINLTELLKSSTIESTIHYHQRGETKLQLLFILHVDDTVISQRVTLDLTSLTLLEFYP